jgi:hypothetical protein
MKPFNAKLSLQIDHALFSEENSRGMVRFFWRIVRNWLEDRAMGH